MARDRLPVPIHRLPRRASSKPQAGESAIATSTPLGARLYSAPAPAPTPSHVLLAPLESLHEYDASNLLIFGGHNSSQLAGHDNRLRDEDDETRLMGMVFEPEEPVASNSRGFDYGLSPPFDFSVRRPVNLGAAQPADDTMTLQRLALGTANRNASAGLGEKVFEMLMQSQPNQVHQVTSESRGGTPARTQAILDRIELGSVNTQPRRTSDPKIVSASKPPLSARKNQHHTVGAGGETFIDFETDVRFGDDLASAYPDHHSQLHPHTEIPLATLPGNEESELEGPARHSIRQPIFPPRSTSVRLERRSSGLKRLGPRRNHISTVNQPLSLIRVQPEEPVTDVAEAGTASLMETARSVTRGSGPIESDDDAYAMPNHPLSISNGRSLEGLNKFPAIRLLAADHTSRISTLQEQHTNHSDPDRNAHQRLRESHQAISSSHNVAIEQWDDRQDAGDVEQPVVHGRLHENVLASPILRVEHQAQLASPSVSDRSGRRRSRRLSRTTVKAKRSVVSDTPTYLSPVREDVEVTHTSSHAAIEDNRVRTLPPEQETARSDATDRQSSHGEYTRAMQETSSPSTRSPPLQVSAMNPVADMMDDPSFPSRSQLSTLDRMSAKPLEPLPYLAELSARRERLPSPLDSLPAQMSTLPSIAGSRPDPDDQTRQGATSMRLFANDGKQPARVSRSRRSQRIYLERQRGKIQAAHPAGTKEHPRDSLPSYMRPTTSRMAYDQAVSDPRRRIAHGLVGQAGKQQHDSISVPLRSSSLKAGPFQVSTGDVDRQDDMFSRRQRDQSGDRPADIVSNVSGRSRQTLGASATFAAAGQGQARTTEAGPVPMPPRNSAITVPRSFTFNSRKRKSPDAVVYDTDRMSLAFPSVAQAIAPRTDSDELVQLRQELTMDGESAAVMPLTEQALKVQNKLNADDMSHRAQDPREVSARSATLRRFLDEMCAARNEGDNALSQTAQQPASLPRKGDQGPAKRIRCHKEPPSDNKQLRAAEPAVSTGLHPTAQRAQRAIFQIDLLHNGTTAAKVPPTALRKQSHGSGPLLAGKEQSSFQERLAAWHERELAAAKQGRTALQPILANVSLKNRAAPTISKPQGRKSIYQPVRVTEFRFASDARAQERKEWEARRRAKEKILEELAELDRLEREAQEAAEIRAYRASQVPDVRPIPAFYKARLQQSGRHAA